MSNRNTLYMPELPGVRWLWTLSSESLRPDDFVVAFDKTMGSGTKYYAKCDSYQTLMKLINTMMEQGHQHIYEMIIDVDRTPCFLSMDVEREIYTDIDSDIIQKFHVFVENTLDCVLQSFSDFLKQTQNFIYEPIIGDNVHVCQAHIEPTWDPCDISHINKTAKMSFHIHTNLLMPSWRAVGNIVDNFLHSYKNSSESTVNEVSHILFFNKRLQNGKVHNAASIIDTSVYTNKRLWRCLYSTKMKENAVPLTPFKNSSSKIEHHMVNYYPDACMDIKFVRFDNPVLKYKYETEFKNTNTPKYSNIQSAKVIDVTYNKPHNMDPGKPIIVPCTLPQTVIDSVIDFLENSHEIRNLMGRHNPKVDKVKNSIHEAYALFVTRKSEKCICPVAHRVHSNNNCEFHYDHTKCMLYYQCRNETCKNNLKQRSIKISFCMKDPEEQFMRRVFCSDNVNKTINGLYDFVKPTEQYSEPVMRQLPPNPRTIVVEAPCGAGKTSIIIDQLKKTERDSSILVVSHSRNLCYSIHQVLKDYDFALYNEEAKGHFLLCSPRLICCINSIHRIAPDMVYDVLIIDEHMSVAASTSQPATMMRHNIVIPSLVGLCKESGRVIFMDANSSSYSAYSFTKYVSKLRGGELYWIRNTYRRQTNRTFKCIRCVSNTKAIIEDFKKTCLALIIDRVRDNKRLVVPTSSSDFASFVYEELKALFPQKEIKLYTGETEEEVRVTDIRDVNTAWSKLDILIYSPAINAGVSFTVEHFHEAVCFFINSPKHPPVDVVYQMCFRVRMLIDGHTTLFIHDQKKEYTIPLDPWGIERHLDGELRSTNGCFSDGLYKSACHYPEDSRVVQFKKDHLSYYMLRGYTHATNLSRMHFSSLLINTIERELNVECSTEDFPPPSSNAKGTVGLALSSADASIVPSSCNSSALQGKRDKISEMVTTIKWCQEFEYLATRFFVEEITKKNLSDRTEKENQAYVVYEIISILHLRTTLTEKLFGKVVAPFLKYGHKYKEYAHKSACNISRFRRLNKPIEENTEVYLTKLKSIMGSEDPNITLAETPMREWYDVLLILQKLLHALLTVEERVSLVNNFEAVTISTEEFNKRLQTYLDGHTDQYLKDAIKRVGLRRDTFRPLPNENYKQRILSKGKSLYFVKGMMEKGGILVHAIEDNSTKKSVERTFSVCPVVKMALFCSKTHNDSTISEKGVQ